MALLGVVMALVGAATVGWGRRRAPHRFGSEIIGAGVVLFFGGVALVSFRSGDRVPWFVLGATALLLAALARSALSRPEG